MAQYLYRAALSRLNRRGANAEIVETASHGEGMRAAAQAARELNLPHSADWHSDKRLRGALSCNDTARAKQEKPLPSCSRNLEATNLFPLQPVLVRALAGLGPVPVLLGWRRLVPRCLMAYSAFFTMMVECPLLALCRHRRRRWVCPLSSGQSGHPHSALWPANDSKRRFDDGSGRYTALTLASYN
jgi:hypothetical protein